MLRLYDFYPRSPCGERPHFHLYTDLIVSNFYPRSPCGERLQGQCPPGKEPVISIHALLAESDHSVRPSSCPAYRFLSTLSLRRATFFANVKNVWDHVFLSTLSLRRATTMRPWMQAAMTYFYPRSPCGERPSARSLVASLSRQFLSTLSLRRATAGQFCPGRTFQISIHALLAESDRHCADTLWFRRHISIHALLAESDQAVPAATPRAGHFYPRSPCGERQCRL